jgi:hypothetical protein
MSFAINCEAFSRWLDEHVKKGRFDVPGRIATILALLERLQDNSSLVILDHTARSGTQLEEHNKYVERGLRRFEITSPIKELGRRSSNLHAWIGPLFDLLQSFDFESLEATEKESLLFELESVAAKRLEVISQDKPLIARYNKVTVKAIIEDILDQAQEKNRAKDVAEYLVGAKLQLRFGADKVTPKNVNTPNRKKPADFLVGNAAIEVTVNPADKRHVEQIKGVLKDTEWQVWLLVRLRDREKWQTVIDVAFGASAGLVVVADIETFVGQNIAEIGGFQHTKVVDTLVKLLCIYNDKWLPREGSNGIRIAVPDQE